MKKAEPKSWALGDEVTKTDQAESGEDVENVIKRGKNILFIPQESLLKTE